MPAFNASSLWWPPFGPLYDDLSHPMKTSIEDVGRVLQANKHKLLQVLSFFRPPTNQTTAIIKGNEPIELEHDIHCDRRRLNDPSLAELALKASKHLNLDAVQAYLLVLHYQDLHGRVPMASMSRNRPSYSTITLRELQVFYFKERLHLLKCLELMIQDGEASPFWSVTTTLVDEHLDAKVAENIIANLKDSYGLKPSLSDSIDGNGVLGILSTSTVEVSQKDRVAWLAEATKEMCNLLDILIAIWDDPTVLCPCRIWLKLADAFSKYLFPAKMPEDDDVGRIVARAQDLASLVLVQGLHLEDILQQMYSTDSGLEGDALFGRPLSQAATPPATDPGTPSRRSRRTPRNESGSGKKVPGSYLEPADPTVNVSSNNLQAFNTDERMLIGELLEKWCQQESVHLLQVPALLGWAAFLCLHDSVSFDIHSNPVETWTHIETFAGKAWENGGFAALLHLAKADGLRVDYNLATVYKSIQMNLVVVSLAAFGISPLTLQPGDLDAMLQTTYHLFNDQPELCSMFWDVNTLAKEPMFHFLNVARDIFPAMPMPLLYLLAGVCNGPQNATQVHTYLARLPSLTFRHHLEDPDLAIEGVSPGARALCHTSKPIKEIPMLSIPSGTEGVVIKCQTDQQIDGGTHASMLLRRLASSTPTPVNRTISLTGFNVLGGPESPGEGRRSSDGVHMDSVHMDFASPEGTSPRGNGTAGDANCNGNGADRLLAEAALKAKKGKAPVTEEAPLSPFTCLQKDPPEFGSGRLADMGSGRLSEGTPKFQRSLSILTDVDPEEAQSNRDLLVKWSVEPPKGSGMVKVLLEVGVLSRLVARTNSMDTLGDLKVILHLLANMAMADSSTGKELLKYEVRDIDVARSRVTLLSLVCRVMDDLVELPEPSLEAMGLCLNICASLATHAPGEVVQNLMSTKLFQCHQPVLLIVDADRMETSAMIKARMVSSSTTGLPLFRELHYRWERSEGVFNVTEGLLEVLAIVLQKGITSGMVAEAVGWALVTVLGHKDSWTFQKPAQRHNLAELCVRVLRRGLQTVMSAARHTRSNEEVDHRMAFVGALEEFISGPLNSVLPSAFPPPATALEEDRVSSSDLVVTKAVENLAKEVLALIPAMTQGQETQEYLFFRRHGDYPCGAARLSSYLTYSHSDLKMRLLALQSIKVFLEVITGQQSDSTTARLSYLDLLITEGLRGPEGNHALWRNTLVQSTGLVMAGIDSSVCCAALECVRWCMTNQWALMNVLFFPTLLDKKTEQTAPILPWARRRTSTASQSQSQRSYYQVPDETLSNVEVLPQAGGQAELQLLSGGATVVEGAGARGERAGEHQRSPATTSGSHQQQQQQQQAGSSGQMSTSTLSVLDCVWDLLQDAPRLLKEKPQPIAAALQVLALMIQSQHLSTKHREAADILKRQPGFWSAVAACVPARPTNESDHEPERSQYVAEQAALLTMAAELTNYRKSPTNFMRNGTSKDLLTIVRGWEREGWRGRSARINQMLMEREGTTIQDVGTAGTLGGCCTPSKSCVCLGLVVMLLIIIIIFQQSGSGLSPSGR